MKKRGRKSSAELSVAPVSSLLSQPPKPPEHLSKQASDIWRMVMTSRSKKMIEAESYPVLVEYCRSITRADFVSKEIDRFEQVWLTSDEGLKRYDKLISIQDKLTKTINSCAVKLRLTPSTRFHSETAATIVANDNTGQNPWDYDGTGKDD